MLKSKNKSGLQISFGPYDPNLAPKPPKKRQGWAWGGLALVVLLGAGVWWRQGTGVPPVMVQGIAKVPPVSATNAVVETPEEPVVPDLPFGMAAGLAAGEEAEAAAQYGGVRIVANAPDYAQEFLAKTAKRYRMDTNAWAAVANLPHTLTNQPCGLVEVALEVEGFKADPASRSILIQEGRPNDANFALAPLPATLKVTCNATGAGIQIDKQPSTSSNSIPVPSLQLLSVTVSASGYRIQPYKLGPFDPGTIHTQAVELAREAGALRIEATVPTNAAAYLQGLEKRIRLGTNDWKTVKDLPVVEEGLACIETPVELATAGFFTTNERTRIKVEDARTNTVLFRLEPLPAMLKVTCNVTGAVIQINDQPSPTSNSLPVPSLQPLSMTVNATGYVAQVVKLGPMEPGKAYRQEVKLEPSSSRHALAVPDVRDSTELQPLSPDAFWTWATREMSITPYFAGSNEWAAQAYRCFAYHFPDDPRAAEARKRWEDYDLQETIRLDSKDRWLEFSRRFPHRTEAQEKLRWISPPHTWTTNSLAERAIGVLASTIRESKRYAVDRDTFPIGAAQDAAETLGAVGGETALDVLRWGVNNSPSPNLRDSCATALGKVGTPGAIDALNVALENTNYIGQRWVVARALGEAGTPFAVDALLAGMKDRDASIRKYMASGLGKVAEPRAVPALIASLEDADGDVREAAIAALAAVGDKASIDALVDTVKRGDAASLRKATISLGATQCPEAQDALIILAVHTNPVVRKCVMESLGLSKDPHATSVLINALTDVDIGVARAAAEALGRIGDPVAVPPLVATLEDSRSDQRYSPPIGPAGAATVALGYTQDPRAIPALLTHFRKKDVLEIGDVPHALSHFRDSRVVDALVDGLSDPRDRIPRLCARGLGEIGDARAIDPLVEAMKRGLPEAAASLGKLGATQAVPVMVELLQSGGGAYDCAEGLGEMHDPRALNALLDSFQKSLSSDRRKSAVNALGNLGDTRAVDALLKGLSDREIRNEVVYALGMLGDATIGEVLLTAQLKDESYMFLPSIRRIAERNGSAFLFKNMSDADPRRRALAAEAMAEIIGGGGWRWQAPLPPGDIAWSVPPELVKALEDDDISTRVHAATAICRLLSAKQTQLQPAARDGSGAAIKSTVVP